MRPSDVVGSDPILELGPKFWDPVQPARFPQAILRYRNPEAAKLVGLSQLSEDEFRRHFHAFESLPGHLSSPLALRYHGHQFTTYNPDLGDGRGFLFAQIHDGTTLWDFGTKGSGQTPYSRQGDGRLTLKGAFREILCTEMLESLGVDTSRSFAVFETGEQLVRGDEPSPTRSAVLTRMSRGHIRFGTFQRLLYEQDAENIVRLRDYCLRWYFPHVKIQNPTRDFFAAVARAHADLVASFMVCGFVHGVLNTDNMNISGESFDYGPYRFLSAYDPSFTAAYFDRTGLYSFGRQPMTFIWNLEQLGKCLQFADAEFQAHSVLESFPEWFNESMRSQALRRLNLRSRGPEEDGALLTALYEFMETPGVFFEQTWFDLHSGLTKDRRKDSAQKDSYQNESFARLEQVLRDFKPADEEKMRHGYFTQAAPCTLLIEEIESLWAPIAERDDWGPFEKKLHQIRSFRGAF